MIIICNMTTPPTLSSTLLAHYQHCVQPWKQQWLSWQLPAALPAALRNELVSQFHLEAQSERGNQQSPSNSNCHPTTRTSKLSSFLFHIRPLHVCTPQNFKYLETLASPDSIVASWDPFPTKPIATTSWERLFDLQLPEGRCIGLVLSDVDPSHADALTPEGIAHAKHWIHDMLHPQEVSFGVAQPSHHARTSFILGRLAMREALRLERHTSKSISILKDEHGRPTVPNGYLGSISHKGATGVALIATTTEEHLATGIRRKEIG